ncbi:hypothetical protein O166_18605 [Pseudogulbenkiania ferrooxidans EGD-HP2]|uniref:Uncharacterized protein n=2 Tax=Pseudogulbenkiania ferrooxidans TaxID=549169 RepID=A0ABN0NCJ3_9NEIS|nr:hypothetical protein O166_18605 [Pseudogulbenkiania ferrooxidans EGD-HP2]
MQSKNQALDDLKAQRIHKTLLGETMWTRFGSVTEYGEIAQGKKWLPFNIYDDKGNEKFQVKWISVGHRNRVNLAGKSTNDPSYEMGCWFTMPSLRDMIIDGVITRHVQENEGSVTDKKAGTLITRQDEAENVALVGYELLKWLNSNSKVDVVFKASLKANEKPKKK